VLQQVPSPTSLSLGNLKPVDPLEMNLAVARGIPSLSHLDVGRYRAAADHWAAEVRKALAAAESEFHKTPQDWKNDIHFFRLGVLCWYVDEVLGIRYREDQKDLEQVFYTDPSDLFLNGVMDTRRGTCANMPTLHVALAWRLGWPVSLACAWAHLIARYDDGQTRHNIEATNNGKGGFHSHPDDYYESRYSISQEAIISGSDLTSLSPRQTVGLFFGFRARHWADSGRLDHAREDLTKARSLFSENRYLLKKSQEVSLWSS
jgi:hypothetical protein